MKSDYIESGGRNAKSLVLVAGVPSPSSSLFCLPSSSPFMPAKQAIRLRQMKTFGGVNPLISVLSSNCYFLLLTAISYFNVTCENSVVHQDNIT